MQEEEKRDARVPLASHGEDGAFVEEARSQERAKHEAHIATNLAPRDASKNEESLSKELMPALRPKLMQRLRGPRLLHHRRPGAGRVVEDGDGEERDEIVDHAESGDERDAGESVYGGRDEVAHGEREGREEDAPARGLANAWDLLDESLDDVQDQKADEEGAERRAEERTALLRPRGRGRVHPLAKVPAETTHGEHELERILQPQRKEGGALTFARRRRVPRRIRVVPSGDGRNRHGARDIFALLVATSPGQSQVNALADENKGETGGAPVEYVMPGLEPNVAV